MSLDLTPTATVLLGRLGGSAWGDVADWYSEAEAFGSFSEALSRLAKLGLFFVSETFATVPTTGNYALPADWLETAFASVDGQQLRPASAAELLALDSGWAGAVCEANELPSRYTMDAGPLGTITLYPAPSAISAVTLIDGILPSAVSTGQTAAPLNPLVADYCLYFALERARGKESPNAMPEVAQAAAEMVALYESLFQAYWGKAA